MAPPGGTRKRIAFPRPCKTVPSRSAIPNATQASARRGRGWRWPGALAPSGPGVSVALWQGRWPLPWQRRWRFGLCSSAPSPGGMRKRTAFPRPCGTVPRRTAGPGTTAGQRPTRREASARQGRGGRWPGALAHPRHIERASQGRGEVPAGPRGVRRQNRVQLSVQAAHRVGTFPRPVSAARQTGPRSGRRRGRGWRASPSALHALPLAPAPACRRASGPCGGGFLLP